MNRNFWCYGVVANFFMKFFFPIAYKNSHDTSKKAIKEISRGYKLNPNIYNIGLNYVMNNQSFDRFFFHF